MRRADGPMVTRWGIALRGQFVLVATMFFSGCQLFPGPEACHDPIVYAAVHVEVTDAATGEFLALEASGHVEGAYRETMQRHEGSVLAERYLFALGNGPGTYQVFIEAPGYQAWSATAEAVAEGCGGLKGAILEAKLVKQ